jgi:hypothetical protein
MAYADAIKYNKLKSLSGYPVGTIVPWSGTEDTIPVGWKVCNGSYLNITAYPRLFKCIGNTYGGTAGSTFRLPDIVGKGIIDIFRGHYGYLKSTASTYSNTNNNPMGGLNTAAWTPVTTRGISDDPYWAQIGNADNGNTGSATGNPVPSTIDLVGVRNNSIPGLSATVSGLALTPGILQRGYQIMPRKLGDGHIAIHAHTIPTQTGQEISHTQGSTNLDDIEDFWRSPCEPQTTFENNAKRTDEYRNNVTGDHARPGGGNTSANNEFAGNGFSGGDMLAHVGGQKNFHTSINAEFRTWASIGGHSHGSNTITFTSGLSVRSTSTYTDIVSSDVVIDNSAGLDAGTINATTSCPSVSMIFIIKVF